MKKLVAWQEEPVMEAPVEKEEKGVTINMDNGENNFVGELVNEPIETLIRNLQRRNLTGKRDAGVMSESQVTR